jgi:flagellar basal-body rod protein FlgB
MAFVKGKAMFIERMLNDGSAPLLEQVVKFAAARHRLIAENIANVDTPGYRQKDLSVSRFQQSLRELVDRRSEIGSGQVSFDDASAELGHPTAGILFHDRNNRSMEMLASDQAKNALMHNLAIELLRKQFETMQMALRDRVT